MAPTRRSNSNASSSNFEELSSDLSTEGKAIVAIMKTYFSNLESKFSEMLAQKSTEIEHLKSEVKSLKEEVSSLRGLIDESDAYERKDTVILSGLSLPIYIPGEDCSNISREIIKEKL